MSAWIPYPGEYEKEFYDIRLKDGRELKCCWPNAGKFCAQNGTRVKEEYVTHTRLCGHPKGRDE
jgi:hypothetical protein